MAHLATFYRRPKDIRVKPIVIPELKFCNVKCHVFAAHLMERADDAALEDRPEALNRVRVDRADDVLATGVVDRFMRIVAIKAAVDAIFVGRQKADAIGNHLAHESLCVLLVDALQNARDDVALALDGANDRRLDRPA